MNKILQKNLACLPPPLASRLSSIADAEVHDRFCVMRSKSGVQITGLATRDRCRGFHSSYDPEREAARLAQSVATPTVFCFGFGSGLHLSALLKIADLVIVIEPDEASVRHALSVTDLSDVLDSAGLHILTAREASKVSRLLPELYIPAVHGSASAVALPGRVESDPEAFEEARSAVEAALSGISSDFATQSRFGRLWLRNALANLSRIVSGALAPSYPDFRNRPVVVAGAGPSLDGEIDALRLGKSHILVATDTAFPALAARGVCPDAVVTVDCQPTGYLHYLGAGNRSVPLLADLMAAPAVVRAQHHAGLFLSHHPLSALLQSLGASFPTFDSSGGNVTHAAAAIAVELGAQSVQVIGADFCYPGGQAYVSHTYIQELFLQAQDRLRPAASRLFQFVQDRPGAYRDPEDESTIRLPNLDAYSLALQKFSRSAVVPVKVGRRLGEPEGPQTSNETAPQVGDRTVTSRVPNEILHLLLKQFEAIPPGSSVSSAALSLLPLAAWLRREDPDRTTKEVLQAAQQTALSLVRTYAAL